jgi:hypothetical protein
MDAQVERGSRRLGAWAAEDGGDMHRVVGDTYGVRYLRKVWWFGPQNPGGGFEEERTARGGIEEFASRRSYLVKGAVAVR